MFNQSYQQGQYSHINSSPGRQGLPMGYNFQQPQSAHQQQQQQQHTQHHSNIQHDHNAHPTNGTVLGHHTSYSPGVLSDSTSNFTANSLQNEHLATTRGGQAQQINEHWADQLKLYKESQKAHSAMVDQHAPHYYARIKAAENRQISSTVPNDAATTTQEEKSEGFQRPSNLDSEIKRQDWHNMDLSGNGLRVLALPLFDYIFLNELYVASNKISRIPAAIRQLRHLRHLDASNNLLTEVPPELGMCVYLKNLLLFDNNIRTLPNEMGSLYQLEMLGVEGNPLDAGIKREIMERGTKALIHRIQEQAPSKRSKSTFYR